MFSAIGAALGGFLNATAALIGAIGTGLSTTMDVSADLVLTASGIPGANLTATQLGVLQGGGGAGYTAVTGALLGFLPIMGSSVGIGPLLTSLGTLTGALGAYVAGPLGGIVGGILQLL